MNPTPNRALRHLIGPTLLLFLSICFCWKLVLTNQYTWMDGPDLANQVLPWFQFEAGEVHAGRFPAWDPNHWLGQPLIGQAQPGAAYPLNWILFAMPLHNGWISQKALHWYFLLIHYLAALFCYWLCRDLGRSRPAAVIAGLVFAFGGFVGTNDWPQMLNGCIWTPLVFLFLFRSVGGRRVWESAILSGFFLGMSWLSGHHQIPIFVTLATSGTWLWYTFREGKLNRSVALAALVCFGMLFVTSALQTLPALEYGKLAKRWVGVEEPMPWNLPVPYSVHRYYSYAPATILGFVFAGMHQHVDAFMGLVAVALALYAISVLRHQVIPQVLAAITLGGFIFCLGGFTLLQGVFYSLVPLVEKARTPGNAVFLCNFSCSILSAIGIDHLLSSRDHEKQLRYVLLGFSAITFVLSGAILFAGKTLADERVLITGVVAAVAAVALSTLERQAAVLVLGFLVVSELGMVFGQNWPNWYDPNHTGYLRQVPLAQEAVGFLRTRLQPLRVDVDDKVFGFNLGDYYGVETLGGYLASLTTNLTDMETHTPRAQQLFAVGYHIGKQQRFPEDRLVYEGKNDIKVYEYPLAFPRVRAVHQVIQLPSSASFRPFIADQSNDLRRLAAVVGKPPDLQECDTSGEEVNLVQHLPDALRIEANLKCRGMVVLADTYFPGWRATVDGKPAKIWEVYGVLRGIVVEPGVHSIKMAYRPVSVLVGAILSGLGFVLALAAILRRHR